jgi:hypothetical protein
MTEGSVGPLQPKRHILPKRIYRRYETSNTNKKSPKPNSSEKQMGHNPP